MRDGLSMAVVFLLLAGSLFTAIVLVPANATAATLYVGGSGPGNYTTIQAAVNAANPGDTVYVYAGSYPGDVSINKPLSLEGQSAATTVIDNSTIYVTARWVSITGFHLAGAGRHRGISFWSAQDCLVADNIISNYVDGIFLNTSTSITMTNNTFINTGIYIFGRYGNEARYWNTHTIDTSNTVNGKPVYYWKNVAGGTVPSGAGQVILGNVSNVAVSYQRFDNTSVGVEVGASAGVVIDHSSFSSMKEEGIGFYYSDSNWIAYDGVTLSPIGFRLWVANRNTIMNNTVTDNDIGVYLVSSNGNTVRCVYGVSHNNQVGILIEGSSGNNITRNPVLFNKGLGIQLQGSDNNMVYGNTASSNAYDGIMVSGGLNNTILANTADSNVGNGMEVSGGSGNHVIRNTATNNMYGIRLYSTSNTDVFNNRVTGNTVGILVGTITSSNRLDHNTVMNNRYGISLAFSQLDVVVNNNISWNAQGGIVVNATLESIYHNNLTNNTPQGTDLTSNMWDNGYPSRGNYWSDYTGVDNLSGPNQDQPGSDGIGDTPYLIAGGNNKDRYPLMHTVGPGPWPPSAPQNLQATEIPNAIFLNWMPPLSDGGSPITGFIVYRGTSPGGESYLTSLLPSYNYTDGSVTIGQRYYYKVSAWNSAGEGPLSNEANATTTPSPTKPGPPRNLTATAGAGQIALAWLPPLSDGGSPITNYSIYRGLFSGGETLLAHTGNVPAFYDATVVGGQMYCYKVTAWNSAGESTRSNEACATTLGPPGAPYNLTATPGNARITLNWYPPQSNGSGLVAYRIYRANYSGGECFLVEIGVNFTYTDYGLTNGQRYYYQVSARNAVGEGPRSNEASAVPYAPYSTPGSPYGLNAAAGDRQVALTWYVPVDNGGTPINYYRIYRGTFSGGEAFYATTGNSTFFLDTGVSTGQTYYYRVSAVNAIGEGPLSNEAWATPTSGQVVPTEPRNLRATAGDRQVALDWLPPASNGSSYVYGYRIYRGYASGGEAFLAETAAVLSYVDSGLSNGVTYYYRVSARNSAGEGPLSNEAWATPSSAVTAPTAPLSLQAAGGDTQATLTWGAPVWDGGSPVTGYRIYRGTFAGGEAFNVEIGNSTSYVDVGLTNGQAYFYKVAARNSAGEGPMSNEASVVPAAPPLNLPPACNIIAPLPNATVSGTFMIAGIALDLDGIVRKVEIRIDNGPWSEAFGNSSWTYEWDTKAVQNGPHVIYARSFDGSVFSTVVNVTVTVSNAPPPQQEPLLQQMWFWGMLAVILLETTMLLYLVLTRPRKKMPEKSNESVGVAGDEEQAPNQNEEQTQ